MPSDRESFYEEKAQAIKSYLKTDIRYDLKFLPPPFCLEFTGSPSSGKTTVITELDKLLRREGLRVLRPQEGAEVIRHIERDTPLYNIRTGLYALSQLIDFSHSHLYDVVIFDRCAFDVYGWMNYWFDKDHLTVEERDTIQSFSLSRFWMHNISLAYFMVCETEEAMRRELEIAASEKTGETTNPASIARLVNRYRAAYGTLAPSYKQLRLLDTTHLEKRDMVRLISDEVFNELGRISLSHASE